MKLDENRIMAFGSLIATLDSYKNMVMCEFEVSNIHERMELNPLSLFINDP